MPIKSKTKVQQTIAKVCVLLALNWVNSLEIAAESEKSQNNTAPNASGKVQERAKQRSEVIRKAEALLRDYGRIDMASPLLISLGTDFSFNLGHDARFYFDQYKTNSQGANASFLQSQFALKSALMLQENQMARQAGEELGKKFKQELLDSGAKREAVIAAAEAQKLADLAAAETNTTDIAKAQARAAALAKYANALPGSVGGPSTPTNSPGVGPEGVPDLPSAEKSAFKDDKFSGMLSLLSNLNSTISTPNRSAIIGAAGDKWTADLFKALGDTNRSAEFKENNTYFGFTTVSVEPGLRTQKDYAAHVSATATIEYVPARPEVVLRMLAKGAQTWFNVGELAFIARSYGYRTGRDLEASLNRIGLEAHGEVLCAIGAFGTNGTIVDKNTFSSNATGDKWQISKFQSQGLLQAGNDEDSRKIFLDRVYSEARDWEKRLGEASHPANLNNPLYTNKVVPVATTVVGPLNESDNVDLAQSTRLQREFALQMAGIYEAAGISSKGNIFSSYARRLEEDSKLKTAWNAVNSFSGAEGSFGFEIGPRPLRASGMRKGRERELQRHSFPALLLLQVGRGGSDLRYSKNKNQITLFEPAIRIIQHRRWRQISTGFWRGLHPLHVKPFNKDLAIPLVPKTPLYLLKSLDPMSWAHSKDDLPEVSDLMDDLSCLISVKADPGQSNEAIQLIQANRAREISDQLIGGVTHVNLPVESIVRMGATPKPARLLEIVRVLGTTTFSVDRAKGVQAKLVLQFNEEVPANSIGLVGAFGSGANFVSNSAVSGRYLSFDVSVTNVADPVSLPIGATLGGKEAVYSSNLFNISLKDQPGPSIKDVLLPQSLTWKTNESVEGFIELSQSFDVNKMSLGVIPTNYASIAVGASVGAFLRLSITPTNALVPPGGAILISLITNQTNTVAVSKPIPVRVLEKRGDVATDKTTSLHYQIATNQNTRIYTLTVPDGSQDRVLSAMTELTGKDVQSRSTNVIVLPDSTTAK